MAAGCKKCDPHELCEECPEWIFTLADLIMCMMGLFVILWVLKPGPKPDQQAAASEELTETLAQIREAFGYVPNPNSNDPIDMHMLMRKLTELKQNGPGERGKSKAETSGAEGTDPEVTTIRTGKQSAVGGRMLFEKGDSKLTPTTMRALDEIAAEIRGHRNIVMIKGHTALDDFDEASSPEQKMDLSLRRAQAAADYLTGRGVSPDMIRVQGCSTFEPVLQRAYAQNAQAVNRRVEVEATATLVPQLQDNPEHSEPNSKHN